MAGIFDMFQPQGGTGLFGNFFGNNQDALLALGMGLASGQTPSEGFRYGLQGLLQGRKSDRERVAGQEFSKELAPFIGAVGGPPMAPQAAPQVDPNRAVAGSPYGPAIAGIESGGKYDALGPVTKTGDRAFGKYQVMGQNIPVWTKEVLGSAMTPEQFIATPEAQEAVFKAKFGNYVQKYGPEGAARAWFAGEGGMNNPNARDQLGTTVSSYAQKFNAGMQPIQVAQAGGGPVPMPQQQAVPQTVRDAPLPMLFKWMMNPNLGGPQREVVKELFKAKLEDSKMTEQQKNYMWSKANGDTRSPSDFMNPPSFGETGQRDEFDRPIQGWRNQNTQTVSPASGAATGPSVRAPIEFVTKLRKEVQDLPSYKNIAAASPVYQSMKEAASRDDRAADVNMIYGLAKIMDPTSVVRESEMTIAQAVATLPQQLRATVESQLTATGRLSAPVREAIMREAHSRVAAYNKDFDQAAGQYKGIATRYRMNLEDVLPQFGPFEPYKAPVPPSADGWMPAPGGARIREKK